MPINFQIVAYDDLCDFGKWLYGLEEEVRRHPGCQKVKNLHHDFHSVAEEIIQSMKLKQFEKARKLLDGEYLSITTQLQCALRAWQDAINEKSETS